MELRELIARKKEQLLKDAEAKKLAIQREHRVYVILASVRNHHQDESILLGLETALARCRSKADHAGPHYVSLRGDIANLSIEEVHTRFQVSTCQYRRLCPQLRKCFPADFCHESDSL